LPGAPRFDDDLPGEIVPAADRSKAPPPAAGQLSSDTVEEAVPGAPAPVRPTEGEERRYGMLVDHETGRPDGPLGRLAGQASDQRTGAAAVEADGGGVQPRRDVVPVLAVERLEAPVGADVHHHLGPVHRHALEGLLESDR
jgi:hypothetical protein